MRIATLPVWAGVFFLLLTIPSSMWAQETGTPTLPDSETLTIPRPEPRPEPQEDSLEGDRTFRNKEVEEIPDNGPSELTEEESRVAPREESPEVTESEGREVQEAPPAEAEPGLQEPPVPEVKAEPEGPVEEKTQVEIPEAQGVGLPAAPEADIQAELKPAERESPQADAPEVPEPEPVAAPGKAPSVSSAVETQDELEPGPLPVNIILNGGNQGDHIVVLTPDRDILVPRQALGEMGFKDPPAGVDFEGEPHVSLGALAPQVQYELDEQTGTLKITADPTLLRESVIDLAGGAGKATVLSDNNSAYLNYSIDYLLDDEGEFVSITVPYEIALRLGGTLAFSSFSYGRTRTEENSVRLLSNLTWDFQEVTLRVVAGDFSASTGRLGSGGLFGGLSLFTNFELTPRLIRHPVLSLSGVLETPSLVEVFVDGNRISSQRLPPGEFELLNIPGAIGSGDAELVITDAFGREERIQVPFFISTRLLQPGLQEYSYSLGARREAFGVENAEYGEPALLGFHRAGLSDYLTGGLRGEVDERVVNGGVEATFALGGAGDVNLGFAFSREKANVEGIPDFTGQGGFLSYGFSLWFFNISLSGQALTREYATLSLRAEADKSKRLRSASLGINLGLLGSLSGNVTRDESFISGETITSSLRYSTRVFRVITLSVSSTRTQTILANEETGDTVFFVSLSAPLGGGHSASLTHSEQDDGLATDSVAIQKFAPAGTGFGYRFSGQREETLEGEPIRSGSAFLQYRGPYGEYSVTHNRIGKLDSSNLNTAGSISLVGGSLNLSRPIFDSFAVVRVGEVEDVRVSANNQVVGTTDSDGEVLVPRLVSYSEQKISVKDTDFPIDYDIKETRKSVAIPFRSGALVEFDAKKLQAFFGTLFYRVKGENVAAEFAGLELDVGGKPTQSIVGEDGEFYLENIPAGSYPARLFDQKRECRFEFVIPETEEPFVEMGEVVCEIN